MLDSEEILSRSRPREFVQGLERGLMVIRALAAAAEGRTIAQAARDTGLTRAVARRYLFTLRSLGYAVQVGDRFRATPRFLELGLCGRPVIDLGSHVEPALDGVLQALGDRGSAAVSLLDGSETVVVAARGEGGLRLEPGLRRAAAETASGLVLLGILGPEEWPGSSYRSPSGFLLGESHQRLPARVAEAAAQGFAESGNATESGRLELAVPIPDGNGTILAALEVSLPSTDGDEPDRHRTLEVIRGAAQHLSAAACG